MENIVSIAKYAISMNFSRKENEKKIPPFRCFVSMAAAVEKFLQLATGTVIATSKKSHDRKTINHSFQLAGTQVFHDPDPQAFVNSCPIFVRGCCIFMQSRETSSPSLSPSSSNVQLQRTCENFISVSTVEVDISLISDFFVASKWKTKKKRGGRGGRLRNRALLRLPHSSSVFFVVNVSSSCVSNLFQLFFFFLIS